MKKNGWNKPDFRQQWFPNVLALLRTTFMSGPTASGVSYDVIPGSDIVKEEALSL